MSAACITQMRDKKFAQILSWRTMESGVSEDGGVKKWILTLIGLDLISLNQQLVSAEAGFCRHGTEPKPSV